MTNILDQSLKIALDNAETKEEKVDIIVNYITVNGQTNYDEMVTQYQHAVQSAFLAKSQGFGEEMVTAALLHDLGHLLADEHDNHDAFLQEDLNHEQLAATYLKDQFSDKVLDPIRLHVNAKRYICTTDKAYYETLSNASKKSFAVQGGFMSETEVAEFEKEIHYKEAVTLRHWDDRAKQSEIIVPLIETYRQDILSCIL